MSSDLHTTDSARTWAGLAARHDGYLREQYFASSNASVYPRDCLPNLAGDFDSFPSLSEQILCLRY